MAAETPTIYLALTCECNGMRIAALNFNYLYASSEVYFSRQNKFSVFILLLISFYPCPLIFYAPSENQSLVLSYTNKLVPQLLQIDGTLETFCVRGQIFENLVYSYLIGRRKCNLSIFE